MSTTYNHTLTAAVAVCAVVDQPLSVQVAVGIGLVVTHPLFDCIPHQHWFDAGKLRQWKHRLGGLVEVGGGAVVLPLVFLWAFGAQYLWLGAAYVIAANTFDAAVLAEKVLVENRDRRWIKRINHAAHFWQKTDASLGQILWELATTASFVALLFLLRP